MNLFQSGKNYLALLGINSTQNVINARSFFASFVFFTNVGLDASFLFYEANSFLKYANSIFLTATVTMIATIFYIAVLQGPNAFEIIDLFEKLVEKSEYFIIQKLKFTGMRTPTLKSMCEEKNREGEKWSKLAFLLIAKCTRIVLVSPKAMFSYWTYYTTDAGRDAFVLPYLIWFPFDWKTPTGYFVAVVIQYILDLYLFMFAATALSTALGGYFVAMSTLKGIEASINTVNDIANFDGNRTQMIEQLSDFV